MRAIRYLKPRKRKIGTSFVTILVIINVVPHKIVVMINKAIASVLWFDVEEMFILVHIIKVLL